MAPYTIHLFSTHSPTDLLLALKRLSPTLQNSSGFNVAAIISGVNHSAPSLEGPSFKAHFAITFEAEDLWTGSYAERHRAFVAVVPEDPSPFSSVAEVDSADGDLEFSLTKELIATLASFSKDNSRPVSMLNFLSFHDGMRDKYMKYVQGFQAEIGHKYGAAPRLLGEVIAGDGDTEGKKWEMVGMIHYPSAATFGRMLQDKVYKDLDRAWKKGVVKDNPILLLVEESID